MTRPDGYYARAFREATEATRAAALPGTWSTNANGSLACPHRDVSVCPACAAHPEVTEVAGAHFYDPTGDIAEGLEVPGANITGEEVPR